jgi:beta-lactamase regulating signal transducer with metallopeptidase domain
LLPDEASEWNEADLRRALVHELEHVRRGDWAIQLVARVTCIFYWFHPSVWVALRRLSLEAERAADDAVVRSAEHTEYAEQLVLLAGRLAKAQAQVALGMANRSDLSARVSALLDDSQRRGRAGWLATATVLSVASLIVLTLAPVRAVTLRLLTS